MNENADTIREALDALEAELAEARRELGTLKRWQKAYAKGLLGLVEQADRDFARAEDAGVENARMKAALKEIVEMHPVDSGLRAGDVARAALASGSERDTA